MEKIFNVAEGILSNLMSYALSLPTTVLAIILVLITLYLLRVSVGDLIKSAIIFFILSFILGTFGIHLPSLLEIWTFIIELLK